MQSISPITYSQIDPRKLSNSELTRLGEVSQDMWASREWLWEYTQCLSCGHIHSKEDVFWTSQKIQDTLCSAITRDPISCQKCNGRTRFMYSVRGNIELIQARLRSSVASTLILAKNQGWEIVGFNESNVAAFSDIYKNDFEFHYARIGERDMSDRVNRILGRSPKYLLAISSIGFISQYRNFQNLAGLLDAYSRAMPRDFHGIPGIAEMDQASVMHRISLEVLKWKSLGYLQDSNKFSLLINIGKNYRSDIIVCEDVVRAYNANFTQWMRHLVRISRQAKISDSL